MGHLRHPGLSWTAGSCFRCLSGIGHFCIPAEPSSHQSQVANTCKSHFLCFYSAYSLPPEPAVLPAATFPQHSTDFDLS